MLRYYPSRRAVNDERAKLMFKLFYAPGTCALATHIALEEAGAPYEAVRLDRSAGAAEPRIPRDQPERAGAGAGDRKRHADRNAGPVAVRGAAFSGAELAPLSDPFALAQVQEFNSYLCATVHVAHAHGRRGSRWADDAAAIEAMKQKVPAT